MKDTNSVVKNAVILMLKEKKTKPKTYITPRMNNQKLSAHLKMNKKYCFLSFVLQPGICQDQNILRDVTIFAQLFNYIFFPLIVSKKTLTLQFI